ncbi:MAG: peptidylprolyl isomerase [Candidatus Portnoybacteria bacterium]|nr:peptidylprolyl isomerase [Candidatus Portnoybacteria bacterium]
MEENKIENNQTKEQNQEEKIVKAIIETEKGDIYLDLYQSKAPKTVNNFKDLANQDFYQNTTFHRVIEDFVIQGGDPLSKDDNPANDGTGGPGYTFENEINPESLNLPQQTIAQLKAMGYTFNYNIESIPHEPGVISMANSGPKSNGSQFFIVTTSPQPHLNGKHTVFGKVTQGMEIVRNIQQDDIIKDIRIIN